LAAIGGHLATPGISGPVAIPGTGLVAIPGDSDLSVTSAIIMFLIAAIVRLVSHGLINNGLRWFLH
jgi:hypothetical protein